ncbi:MAG: hypothetical protein J7J51_00505 [Candidatus Omnitrophica bacterium]|nr:hypothetical protein [Candidatus Omnitrophota bacterium]
MRDRKRDNYHFALGVSLTPDEIDEFIGRIGGKIKKWLQNLISLRLERKEAKGEKNKKEKQLPEDGGRLFSFNHPLLFLLTSLIIPEGVISKVSSKKREETVEELIERIEMAARSRNPDTNLIWLFLIELINKRSEGISALRKVEDKKTLDLIEDILIERYFSSSKEKKEIIKKMLIEIGSPNVIEILKEDFSPSDSDFILLNKIEEELFFLHTIVNEGQLKSEFLVAVPWRDENYAYRLYEVSVVWPDGIGWVIGNIVAHFIEIFQTNIYPWDILSANYLARLLYLENIPLNKVNVQKIIKVLAQAEEEREAFGFVLNRLKKTLLEKIKEAIKEGDYVKFLKYKERFLSLVGYRIAYRDELINLLGDEGKKSKNRHIRNDVAFLVGGMEKFSLDGGFPTPSSEPKKQSPEDALKHLGTTLEDKLEVHLEGIVKQVIAKNPKYEQIADSLGRERIYQLYKELYGFPEYGIEPASKELEELLTEKEKEIPELGKFLEELHRWVEDTTPTHGAGAAYRKDDVKKSGTTKMPAGLEVQLKKEEGHLYKVLATEDQIGFNVGFVPTDESRAKLKKLVSAISQNAFLFGYQLENKVLITDIVFEEELKGYGIFREDRLSFISTRFSKEGKSLLGIIRAHRADSQIPEEIVSLRDRFHEEIRELTQVESILHQPDLIGVIFEHDSEVYIFRNIYDKEDKTIVENTLIVESRSISELLKEPDDFVKKWLDGLKKSEVTIEKAGDEFLPQEAVEKGAEGYYIDLEGALKRLFSTGTLDNVRYLTIGTEEEWSRGLLVTSVSSNTPLGTDKVATCTGLALRFKRGEEFYIALAHIAVKPKSESRYSYSVVKAIFQELKKGGIKDAEVVIYYDPSIQYMPEEFIQFELSNWAKDIRFVQRPDPKTNARILVDGEKVRILFYHDRKLTKSKVIHFSDDVGDELKDGGEAEKIQPGFNMDEFLKEGKTENGYTYLSRDGKEFVFKLEETSVDSNLKEVEISINDPERDIERIGYIILRIRSKATATIAYHFIKEEYSAYYNGDYKGIGSGLLWIASQYLKNRGIRYLVVERDLTDGFYQRLGAINPRRPEIPEDAPYSLKREIFLRRFDPYKKTSWGEHIKWLSSEFSRKLGDEEREREFLDKYKKENRGWYDGILRSMQGKNEEELERIKKRVEGLEGLFPRFDLREVEIPEIDICRVKKPEKAKLSKIEKPQPGGIPIQTPEQIRNLRERQGELSVEELKKEIAPESLRRWVFPNLVERSQEVKTEWKRWMIEVLMKYYRESPEECENKIRDAISEMDEALQKEFRNLWNQTKKLDEFINAYTISSIQREILRTILVLELNRFSPGDIKDLTEISGRTVRNALFRLVEKGVLVRPERFLKGHYLLSEEFVDRLCKSEIINEEKRKKLITDLKIESIYNEFERNTGIRLEASYRNVLSFIIDSGLNCFGVEKIAKLSGIPMETIRQAFRKSVNMGILTRVVNNRYLLSEKFIKKLYESEIVDDSTRDRLILDVKREYIYDEFRKSDGSKLEPMFRETLNLILDKGLNRFSIKKITDVSGFPTTSVYHALHDFVDAKVLIKPVRDRYLLSERFINRLHKSGIIDDSERIRLILDQRIEELYDRLKREKHIRLDARFREILDVILVYSKEVVTFTPKEIIELSGILKGSVNDALRNFVKGNILKRPRHGVYFLSDEFRSELRKITSIGGVDALTLTKAIENSGVITKIKERVKKGDKAGTKLRRLFPSEESVTAEGILSLLDEILAGRDYILDASLTWERRALLRILEDYGIMSLITEIIEEQTVHKWYINKGKVEELAKNDVEDEENGGKGAEGWLSLEKKPPEGGLPSALDLDQLERIKELKTEDITEGNIAGLLMTLPLGGERGRLARAILTKIYLRRAEDIDRILKRLEKDGVRKEWIEEIDGILHEIRREAELGTTREEKIEKAKLPGLENLIRIIKEEFWLSEKELAERLGIGLARLSKLLSAIDVKAKTDESVKEILDSWRFCQDPQQKMFIVDKIYLNPKISPGKLAEEFKATEEAILYVISKIALEEKNKYLKDGFEGWIKNQGKEVKEKVEDAIERYQPKKSIEPRIGDILRKLKLSDDYSYSVDKLLKSKILTDNVLKNIELAKEYANNAGRAIKNYEILSRYFPVDPIMDREVLLGVEPEELRGIIREIPEGMRTVEEIKEGIKKLREKKELEEERAIKPEVLEKEFEKLSKKQRDGLVIIKGLCESSGKGEITHYQNRVFREVTFYDLAKVLHIPNLTRQIVNKLVDTKLIETRSGVHFLSALRKVVFYSINRNAIELIEEYEEYLDEIEKNRAKILKVIGELDLKNDEKRILISIYEGKGLADIRESLISSFVRNTLSKFKELGYIRKAGGGKWELTYKFEKLLYSLAKSPFSYHLLPERIKKRIKKDINLGLMKEVEVFFRMIELRMMQFDSVITRARIREIIPERQLGTLVTLSRRGYIREVEEGYELSIERDIREMQRGLEREKKPPRELGGISTSTRIREEIKEKAGVTVNLRDIYRAEKILAVWGIEVTVDNVMWVFKAEEYLKENTPEGRVIKYLEEQEHSDSDITRRWVDIKVSFSDIRRIIDDMEERGIIKTEWKEGKRLIIEFHPEKIEGYIWENSSAGRILKSVGRRSLSTKEIMSKTGLNPSTIRKWVDILESDGWVEIEWGKWHKNKRISLKERGEIIGTGANYNPEEMREYTTKRTNVKEIKERLYTEGIPQATAIYEIPEGIYVHILETGECVLVNREIPNKAGIKEPIPAPARLKIKEEKAGSPEEIKLPDLSEFPNIRKAKSKQFEETLFSLPVDYRKYLKEGGVDNKLIKAFRDKEIMSHYGETKQKTDNSMSEKTKRKKVSTEIEGEQRFLEEEEAVQGAG